ncbi:MAG: 2-C-methyl-D-erythritol 4-phosphate cytidylyltransferase [Breznakibacter sp.]|nr:2-C-methyl-D-erythritol 4-phosphate cytidylyltransferase [Breznakibacter sp.]
MSIKKSVIIVAGGAGKRMGSETPKQFLLLKGKPILMHTIEAFYNYSSDIQIIVVLPETQIDEWNRLIASYNFTIRHQIAIGGKERFDSVKNGLQLVDSGSFTAIHDGVRPLVSNNTISRCFELAIKEGSAIPVIDVFESIRQITTNGNRSVPRGEYKLVQTPQIFSYKIITESYNLTFNENFTDDASVVEACGYPIYLTEGNRENIKVTTPIDMAIGESLLRKD